MSAPIFSRPRYLPGSKINGAQIDHAVISDGCIINHATHQPHHRRAAHHGRRGHAAERVSSSRQRLLRGAGIRRSATNAKAGRAWASAKIARLRTPSLTKTRASATTCTISPAGKPENLDHERYYIRDGIVIIPKDAVIPDGTVI
jgi:glucose-1-phosphate adenylyltransferase